MVALQLTLMSYKPFQMEHRQMIDQETIPMQFSWLRQHALCIYLLIQQTAKEQFEAIMQLRSFLLTSRVLAH